MEKETINIYYHTDFDGILSAVLVSAYLKGLGYKTKICAPLEISTKDEMLGLKFKKPFAIVDFPYNEKAFVYFDHHGSSKPEKISRETKYWAFDDKSKSCAHIIFNLLSKDEKNKFDTLIRWCDIVDSASYVEEDIPVKEILFPTEPVLILSRSLELAKKNLDANFWNSIVEKLIENQNINELIRDKKIQEYYKIALENQKEAMTALKENSEYDSKKRIVVYDTTNKKWSRFGLALIYPESVIWLGLRTVIQGFVDISMGQNPWNPKSKIALEKIHVGEILKKYGGGGHKDVGSARFDLYEKAKKALDQIKKEIEEKIII